MKFKQIALTRHLAGGCFCKDYPNRKMAREASFGNFAADKTSAINE